MTENELNVQKEIIKALDEDISGEISFEHFIDKLEEYINYLIQNDFHKLLSLLYKIDINEDYLRKLLRTENEDSAMIITKLIINRQSEKIKTRQQFSIPNPGEEKW